MGTWGPGIFSDDFACDLRDQSRDALADGRSLSQAVADMERAYRVEVDDPDQAPVFWLALAATAWKLGRMDAALQARALAVIAAGAELHLWEGAERAKRQKVLTALAVQLSSAQAPAVKLRKRRVAETTWQVGDVVALRLASGRWTLLHVVGYFTDRGGRFPQCEVLDWLGDWPAVPDRAAQRLINRAPVLPPLDSACPLEFTLAGVPTKAEPRLILTGLRRLARPSLADRVMGLFTRPTPKRGRPFVLWQHLDGQFPQIYGLE